MNHLSTLDRLRCLIALYDGCPEVLRAEAMVSYYRYNQILRILANRYDSGERTACAVFAALSPNNDYVGNLRDTMRVLEWAQRPLATMDDFKVSTYDQNKKKAWAIATGKLDPGKAFEKPTSIKTRNFFANCLNPDDPEPITIDGHMYWAWSGRRGVVKTRATTRPDNAPPSLHNGAIYADIADAVRFVAAMRGVIPCQAQAVIWQSYRCKYNIQGQQQIELLASDLIATHIQSLS